MAWRSWLLLPLLAGCATVPLRAVPEKLQPWTTTLRDQQPEDAFAAVYRIGHNRLVFVGAKHANSSASLTFRLINAAYATFQFDTVIAEGFPTSRGPNPASIFKYVAGSPVRDDGFVEAGETVPTALGARAENAVLWGGELGDLEVRAQVEAAGVSPKDLLGFYVLRNIPQWNNERQIEHAADPRLQPLVVAALTKARAALQLPPDVLPGFAEWAAWYQATNGRSLGAGFVTEEVGPLADGQFGTNRIAYEVSRARDAYLHAKIIEHLNAGESVLVVFGASHLLIQRPALDASLGAPCYVGTDLERAALACR